MARSPTVTGSTVTSGGDSIVEPPASTFEAVASGGSPAAKTFAAFTDTDSTINNYAATVVNAVGSTTVSGSGLGPYTLSGSTDGDSFTLKLDARNASNEVLATAVHAVDVAAAGGAAWSTVAEVDFSTDITDLTLTIGGGDTTLYEADGTTVKATVGAVQRVSAPNTATARITAADGGFLIRAQKNATSATDGYVKFTSTDVDFTDLTKIYAIDAVVTSTSFGANADKFAAGLSNATTIVGDDSHMLQQQRVSASSFNVRSIRTIGASSTVGSGQDSQTSAYTYTVRIIIWANTVVQAWSARQSSYLSAFPSAGGVVSQFEMGTPGVAVDSAPGIYGTPFYIGFEALTGGNSGGDTSAVVTKVRLQEYA
jgi:hypothetical protein